MTKNPTRAEDLQRGDCIWPEHGWPTWAVSRVTLDPDDTARVRLYLYNLITGERRVESLPAEAVVQ